MNRALVALILLFCPVIALARGGGGCVAKGTPIATERGLVAVEKLRPGDYVHSLSSGSGPMMSKVLEVVVFTAESMVRLTTQFGMLSLSAEHPVAIPGGAFRMAGTLQSGDRVLLEQGEGVLRSVDVVPGVTAVYNLVTEWPSTFRANGVWVHNKGCFLPETPVLLADGTERPISELKANDRVRAFSTDGRIVSAAVRNMFHLRADHYFEIRTKGGLMVKATPEHPFYVGQGLFRTVESLRPGDTVMVFRSKMEADQVDLLTRIDRPVEVYNLQTDAPNTFVAAGFAVHNKGGGFGGGGHSYSGSSGYSGGGYGYGYGSGYGYGRGYYGYSRSGYWYRSRSNVDNTCTPTGDPDYPYSCYSYGTSWGWDFFWVFLVIIAIAGRWMGGFFTNVASGDFGSSGQSGGIGGEFLHSPSSYGPKVDRTRKELEQLAKREPSFRREDLLGMVRKAFVTLQGCWEQRNYSAMIPMVTQSMRNTHEAQIASMVRNHEINRISALSIEAVEIVHFQASAQEGGNTITALIQARMADFYEDDRDGNVIRGEKTPRSFQEFWTFTRRGARWFLAEIEQAQESSSLQEANIIDGKRADSGQPPAIGILAKVEQKISVFAKSESAWNPMELRALARATAINFFLSFERENSSLLQGASTSDFQERFNSALMEMKARGAQVEYRNICVRSILFLGAKNESGKKEFSVEVALHAQRVFRQNGQIRVNDQEALPFQERFFFRHDGSGFKLFDSGKNGEAKAAGA